MESVCSVRNIDAVNDARKAMLDKSPWAILLLPTPRAMKYGC